jgi:ubiquitin C-terminal hydrolase
MNFNEKYIGLCNFQNNCFLNTALQCLYNLDSFKKYLIKQDIYNISNLFIDNISKKHSYQSFILNLSSKIKTINFNEENDIHEFLMVFIDSLSNYHSNINHTVNTYEPFYLEWKKNFSNIMDFCFFQSISIIECQKCKHIHYNIENNSMCVICIDEYEDIQKNLIHSFSDYDIPFWICDKCGSQKENNIIRKRISISSDTIIICLKRFHFDNNTFKKNNKPIKVNKFIELDNVLLKKHKNTTFQLKTIANHIGDLHNGHYYANVINHKNESIKIDDLSITKSNYNNIHPYILFYERSTL